MDKTGTITENEMEVQDVIETDAYDAETMEPLSVLIGDFAAAMDEDNITMRAVKMHFKTGSGKKPLSKCGFSSTVNTATSHLKGNMCLEHLRWY